MVHLAHQRVTLKDVPSVHEEVKGVLLGKSDPLSDNETKLICRQVARGQVPKIKKRKVINVIGRVMWVDLLAALVVGEAGSSGLLTDDGHLVGVFINNLARLLLSLL